MKNITSFLHSKNYAITMMITVLLLPFAYASTEGGGNKITKSNSETFVSTTTSLQISTSTLDVLKINTGPTFSDEEKVRKGKIVSINNEGNSFLFDTGSSTVTVFYDATSSFLTGDGSQIKIDDLGNDSSVYVFGYIKSDKSEILATKIILANKSKFWTLRR